MENQRFPLLTSQPEINIGIIPGFGGTQRLPRLVGPSAARKLILTGDIIDAKEALRIGLIDELVKPGMAVKRAIMLAKKILRNTPVGIRWSQRAIREGMNLPLKDALGLEVDYFSKVCDSEDMKEGLVAFKERRLPQYKGR